MQNQSTTTVEAKNCTRCGELRPITDFHRDLRNQKRGSWCRFCKRDWSKARHPSQPKPQLPDGQKRCGRCKAVKPVTEFYPDASRTDGRKNSCIICSNAWTAAWCARNKSRVAERISQTPHVPTPPDTKQCSRCHEFKPLDRFAINLRYRNGVTGWCRDCRREYSAEYDQQRKANVRTPPDVIRCVACGLDKPSGDFSKKASNALGVRTRCNQCRRQLEWQARPKEERSQRAQEGKLRLYGLTIEQFDAMIIAQRGLCGICGRFMDRPCVDHCHETGKIRGLLCVGCNTKLAVLENKEYFDKARQYLQRYL